MTTFFFSMMGLHVVLFTALYLAGARHVHQGFPDRRQCEAASLPSLPEPAPSLALLVAVKGGGKNVENGLRTLLDQDYPAVRTYFAVADAADPAYALARRLIEEAGADHRAQVVLAGEATSCAQKNHNILAALAQAGDQPSLYVFCDSTHQAPRNLLRLLALPIIRGEASLTSGFHRIQPGDHGWWTLGQLLVNLCLHCLQAVRAITQPWGGAMAVSRQVFEEHRIAELWSRTIVDDFTMGPLLAKKGVRCRVEPLACLDSPLSGQTWPAFRDWLTRQLLYMKFCTPETWLAVLPVAVALLAAPLGALACLAGLLDAFPLWGLVYFAACFGLADAFRRISPGDIPVARYFAAAMLTFLVTGLLYFSTWLTMRMSWRGISYQVAFGGTVRRIIRR